MIEVKNLKKKYSRGKEVITDLSLTFGEVGLNVIVGKSGCGKTTLINMLGGMDLDYEGKIVVDGKALTDLSYEEIADYRNYTSAFVFQKNSLFEYLTVEENLKLCLNIQNNDANISEALERVGLAGFEKKKVKALSGGEKQRVAIARALIKDCKIVFADEPTSALDSKNAHKIFQLFKELAKDKLVIVVTHDVKKASLYADRMIRLIDGFVEEDIVYHERLEEARTITPRKSKALSLMPIFKYNFKTGLIINLFVTLILIIGLCILNVTNSQRKVKQEYDYYGTSSQVDFNVDRALEAQVKNNINLFDIVKKGDAQSAFDYIKEVKDGDRVLSDADYLLLKNKLSKYDLYESSNDEEYKKLIIELCSNITKVNTTVAGSTYYWRTYEPTNYSYYIYDENNKYNLCAGRLPQADNEILVTDTVADYYLRRRAKNPGDSYLSFLEEYDVDIKDILDSTFDVTDNNGETITLENEFVIYDAYGKTVGNVGGTYTYYLYNEVQYKVVGIIDTGLLNYHYFDNNLQRYYLLDQFVTQDGKEEFMNPLYTQPYGYIVLMNPLSGRTENHNYDNTFNVGGVYYEGELVSDTISAVGFAYDYTGKPNLNLVSGINDTLQNDATKNRFRVLSTTSNKLKDDEIILNVETINKIFDKNLSNISVVSYFEQIKNQYIELTFNTTNGIIKKEFKIVGVSRLSSEDLYISDSTYNEIYNSMYPSIPELTINLEGVSYTARKKLMEQLYDLGFCLKPVDQMPGAYLEFVDGKGEMLASVDYDGLSSLYPMFTTEKENNKTYFVVDGERYGEISGDVVYMKSSVIRNIQLDESYYTTVGNLSPYYLYSTYYNDQKAVTGNSILEVLDSLSTFFLAVAAVLGVGFIYLKEFKQRDSITKLSMLGVRTKDLTKLCYMMYIPMALIIGGMSIAVTALFTMIVNGMYSYTFNYSFLNLAGEAITQECTIHRIRMMFNMTTVYTSLIAMVIIGVVLLLSSIVITLKSRK